MASPKRRPTGPTWYVEVLNGPDRIPPLRVRGPYAEVARRLIQHLHENGIRWRATNKLIITLYQSSNILPIRKTR